MTGRVQINRDDLLRTGNTRLKERAPRKRTAQHRAGDACKESTRTERQIVSQLVKNRN